MGLRMLHIPWKVLFVFFCFLQFHAVVGVLTDDTDPMVSVMKLEKAPNETYADIGGLDQQIQEIKVCFVFSIIHNILFHEST